MSKYIIIDNFVALSEIELSGYYYCRMVDNQQLKNIELAIIYNCHFSNGVTGDFYYIPQKLVKKEADTMEELCDEFVVKYRHSYYRNYSLEKAIQKRDWLCRNNFVFQGEKPDIYGAIWTDKGLIYVAKMNEEGKLELI